MENLNFFLGSLTISKCTQWIGAFIVEAVEKFVKTFGFQCFQKHKKQNYVCQMSDSKELPFNVWPWQPSQSVKTEASVLDNNLWKTKWKESVFGLALPAHSIVWQLELLSFVRFPQDVPGVREARNLAIRQKNFS